VPRAELKLKLLSLAMAAALLVVVRGERRAALTFRVPLEARLPSGYEPASALPEELRVSLSGPWARLRSLDASDIGPVTVDLTRTVGGKASWFVRPESLHLPSGVRVDSLYPSQGTVELQRDRP
jgi:hypothetical protein